MKGIPKSEEVCVWHYNEGGSELLFATTRDFKGMFKLYSISNNVATFTKMKSKNPLDFDEYIDEKKLKDTINIKNTINKARSDLL